VSGSEAVNEGRAEVLVSDSGGKRETI